MMHLKINKQAKTEKHAIGYYETKQAIQVYHFFDCLVDLDYDQSCLSTDLCSLFKWF